MQQYPEDTGAKAKLDQLNEMLDKYEIEAFRRRVQLHPEDAKLHFDLGVILARIGDHDGAIAEFQQARASTSPTQKIQALYHLGLSFEANNSPKLAERNYKEAIKLLEPEDTRKLPRPPLPAGPRLRNAGQQRGRRRALQRGRRRRLLVSRRRPAAETLDLDANRML